MWIRCNVLKTCLTFFSLVVSLQPNVFRYLVGFKIWILFFQVRMEKKILFLITPKTCLDPKRSLSKNKLSKNCSFSFHCVLLKIVLFDIESYFKRDVNGRRCFLTVDVPWALVPLEPGAGAYIFFKVVLHVLLVETFVCLVCWGFVCSWFCVGFFFFFSAASTGLSLSQNGHQFLVQANHYFKVAISYSDVV